MKISNSLYFDHQASTPVPEHISSEILPYWGNLCANPHSADHALGWESLRAVEKSAQQIGQLIRADADEIVFTSGATESNNLALLGLAKHSYARGNYKKRIIVSSIEHKCVLTIGRVLEEQFGFQIEKIPVDNEGLISLSDLETALGDDVLAVSIMAVNNEIGTMQDTKRIADLIRSYGAIFHCDAAQAPLAMDIRSFGRDIDMVSLSGHKMYATKGIGALYIRRDLQDQIEPLVYGGGQQNGLRSGTIPTPLCVGMGAAAEFLGSGQVVALREQLRLRRDQFVAKLSNLEWPVTLNGPCGEYRHPGNASICFKGFIAHDILNVLQPHLAASTGSACTSGTPEPSHVLKAIGLTSDESDASVRFSLGFDTSDEDVDAAVDLISNALTKLSSTSTPRCATSVHPNVSETGIAS